MLELRIPLNLVDSEDFQCAIEAADQSTSHKPGRAAIWAGIASDAAHAIIKEQLQNVSSEPEGVATALASLHHQSDRLSEMLGAQELPYVDLAIKPNEPNEILNLLGLRMGMRDRNLVSHLGGPGGWEDGAVQIGELLIRLNRLSAACEAAEASLRGRIRADRAAGKAEPEPGRISARGLGWIVIRSYGDMTGHELGVSRRSQGAKQGKLAGPLLRYVQRIFERLREKLQQDRYLSHLAESRVWNPADETVRRWVTDVREVGTGDGSNEL